MSGWFSRDDEDFERVQVEIFKKDVNSFGYWKWTRSPGGQFFMFWVMILVFCSTLLTLPWVVDQLLWADGGVGKYFDDSGVAEPLLPGSLVVLDSDWVYSARDARQFEGVSQHELGHVLYYQLLNDSLRREWRSVSADLNRSSYPVYEFSGRYGSSSAEEDFAEMVRAARVCSWDFERLPTASRREFFSRVGGSLLEDSSPWFAVSVR